MCRRRLVDGGYLFSRTDIVDIFENVLNRTLSEVDVTNVLGRVGPNDKGKAGKVIEQSVLGLPADCRPNPDLNIEGVLTELKTTGMKIQTRPTREYKAKEPVSVTGVSPDVIVLEHFENSRFWHKLENLLFVYYHYTTSGVASIEEFKEFPIKGYEFFCPDAAMKERLHNDWTLVRNRVIEIKEQSDAPEEAYKHLSSDLRGQLMMVDLVPRNNPRFRLKSSVMTTIIQEHFEGELEQLPGRYATFNDIDRQCKMVTELYGGKTIEEISRELGMDVDLNQLDKSIGEKVVIKLFGGEATSLNEIDVFSEAGITCKTITVTTNETRTEDTKLFMIDFNEINNTEVTFEDSMFYSFFAERQFICIIFEEPSKESPLKDNVLKGFKRLVFEDDFIETKVKPIWETIRTLVNEDQLVETVELNRRGYPVINRAGVPKTSLNFPKAKYNDIFVRGSGKDSTRKPLSINGISMYSQYLWIKGTTIVNLLSQKEFL